MWHVARPSGGGVFLQQAAYVGAHPQLFCLEDLRMDAGRHKLTSLESAKVIQVTATPAADGTDFALGDYVLTNLASGGVADASTENPPDESSDKLFDGNAFDKWYSPAVPPQWARYRWIGGRNETISQIRLTSATDMP